MLTPIVILIALVIVLIFVLPVLVTVFLRNVEAGTIRMVSWWGGSTRTYRGPGKSIEIPLLTAGTTLSSKAINVDLDITDQTADLDQCGIPRPVKVRVLASAIVSVGDSDELIKTAANRFFSKPDEEQINTLIDLLSSSGRRAVNLLTHDQLFSAKTTPLPMTVVPKAAMDLDPRDVSEQEDYDPLAIIIRKACSRELTDLGLIFNSLNIKVVQSEVADARRRQSAAEAQASADIVAAQQSRRSKEAQLDAERAISDKQRELEQTRAANAALIAEAECKKHDAIAGMREAQLRATDIAQAQADAERVRIAAQARAQADAIQITTVAEATAESIRRVNQAIEAGGESYFRYRQIELLPAIAPAIAQALGTAKLITVTGDNNGEGAAGTALQNIVSALRTVLAVQLFGKSGETPAVDLGASPNGAAIRSDGPVAKV